ncbi:MAG: PD-(D/E)XK nuclease family protein, partial [Terriglobales bacterium]
SDEDLFLFRSAGGNFNYLRTPAPEFPAVAGSLEQLRAWHHLRARKPLPALIEQILKESAVLQFHLLLPHGEQAVANLLRIVELGRQFEQQAGSSLRGFVRWMEQRQAVELAEVEGRLADEDENELQLLTIHTAKGLEFPIVILANFGGGSAQGDALLMNHPRQLVGISLASGGRPIVSEHHAALEGEEKERAREENLRLLYVATTRARDCLAIPMVRPKKTRDPRFLHYFAVADEWMRELSTGRSREGMELLPWATPPEAGEPEPATRKNLGQRPVPARVAQPVLAARSAWEHNLAALGVGAAAEIVPQLRAQEEEGDDWKASARARAFGTAFHRVMQHVALRGDPLLRAMVRQAAAVEGVADAADELEALVARTLAHPLMERARKAQRAWRELPFTVRDEAGIRQGAMDLLLQEEDGVVVVDYKTDSTPDLSSAIEEHREQMGWYRDAVRQVLGRHPKEVVLFFVRTGEARAVEFEEAT